MIGVRTHAQPDLDAPYFLDCLAGLRSVLGENFVVNPTGTDVQGWVLLGPDADQLDRADSSGYPVVVVHAQDPRFLCLDLNNEGLSEQLTAHVLAQGHQRIGFIGGKEESQNARDRKAGHRRALAQAGISWEEALCVPGRFERSGGRRAMESFLRGPLPPTAVVAANDLMALGAWDVLDEKKMAVPSRCALAGFDDVSEAGARGLTSVRQPLESMAAEAGRRLIKSLREGCRPGPGIVRFEGRLMVRRSTEFCPSTGGGGSI